MVLFINAPSSFLVFSTNRQPSVCAAELSCSDPESGMEHRKPSTAEKWQDKPMRIEGNWSELISFNGNLEEMDCGSIDGDNGLQYVHLITRLDKGRQKDPPPTPTLPATHVPKGNWKSKQYRKGGTLTFLALIMRKGHEPGEWVVYLTDPLQNKQHYRESGYSVRG